MRVWTLVALGVVMLVLLEIGYSLAVSKYAISKSSPLLNGPIASIFRR